MIVDTSAVIAIMRDEHGSEGLKRKVLQEPGLIASPNALEAAIVAIRLFGSGAEGALRTTLSDCRITVTAFLPEHVGLAAQAFDSFGKGRHPAGLNFGDCIAYALAKASGQPLLYTGEDFSKTDIQAA